MKKNILLFIIFSVIFVGCKKNSESQNAGGDGQTEEENTAIENASIDNPPLNQILDPNGDSLSTTGVEGHTKVLIDALLKTAQNLCDQKSVLHKKGTDAEPEHYGFVYSYGVRDLNARHFPTKGDSYHTKYSVFGTDCSGFIINLFRTAGVDVAANSFVKDQTLIPSINKALQESDDYNLMSLGVASGPPQSGDLIVWSDHIGIVFYDKTGKVRVYNSNGTQNPGSEAGEQKNLGSRRGAHPFDLAKMIQDPRTNYWGTNYKLYRLKEEDPNKAVIGDWKFTSTGYVQLDGTISTSDMGFRDFVFSDSSTVTYTQLLPGTDVPILNKKLYGIVYDASNPSRFLITFNLFDSNGSNTNFEFFVSGTFVIKISPKELILYGGGESKYIKLNKK